jgi:hypothetical protein
VTVRIGLDHRNHAWRTAAAVDANELLNMAVIGLERVEIDARGGGTNHSSQ